MLQRHFMPLTVLVWNKWPKDFSKEILNDCNTKVYLHNTHCTVCILSWAYESKRTCLYFWFSLFSLKNKIFQTWTKFDHKRAKLWVFFTGIKSFEPRFNFLQQSQIYSEFRAKEEKCQFCNHTTCLI